MVAVEQPASSPLDGDTCVERPLAVLIRVRDDVGSEILVSGVNLAGAGEAENSGAEESEVTSVESILLVSIWESASETGCKVGGSEMPD